MPALETDLIHFMREAAPFTGDPEAKAALRSTLELIGSLLTREERSALAGALPASLRPLVESPVSPLPAPAAGFFELVSRRAGAHRNRAVEAAEVACRAIGAVVPAEVRARLSIALPELERFVQPPVAPDPPPPHVGHPPAVPHDLAEGHAGSVHSLADASPLERAHRHSIARSEDPHADTKLSSARGIAQEREGNTLSSGEPGSHRPLSRDH